LRRRVSQPSVESHSEEAISGKPFECNTI
jgi:hypothetical protein